MAYIPTNVLLMSITGQTCIGYSTNDGFVSDSCFRCLFSDRSQDLPIEVEVVWRDCTVRPFTFEVLLPILDEPRVSPIVLRRQTQEVFVKAGHWIGSRLNREGSLHLMLIAGEDQ